MHLPYFRSAGRLLRNSSADKLIELTEFGTNPGNLNAKHFIPEVLHGQSPLVVVLHGCTQDADGFDKGSGWSALAETYGFALVFPEQRRSNNMNLCFNWFSPADTARDAGEALSISQMVDTMIERYGIDPQRVFITGLLDGKPRINRKIVASESEVPGEIKQPRVSSTQQIIEDALRTAGLMK